MIEGRVKIADHELLVQDGQLMIYIPGGEGSSEPLTEETAESLMFLTRLVTENVLAQEVSHARSE